MLLKGFLRYDALVQLWEAYEFPKLEAKSEHF